jgi:tRNA pseudouridine32 synthase/23S rRNA pseudouridine746 synthase
MDKEPPGGAGDCAAPKLLAYAFRHGLTPIALAEQWIGAPPTTGGRIDGVYYPACRGKCGPILAHMLDGIDVEPAPQYGGGLIAPDEPRPLFEDEWLVIVDKPIGLLSIPGRGGALRDCVATRMRARYPDATGPLVVHRLDLDTSGVLLVAKDLQTYKALQRLFAIREIEKRYIAILDGDVTGESGTIDLPLRVDVDDRPRQIVDPVHGKPAITDWQVLTREGGRTRVALSPKTGRAHQLRVHAAVGLGAPIVGDRLYGRPDGGEMGRLLLHAEAIAFVHPHTGRQVSATRKAPF